MSIPFSGTFVRSAGVISAISKQLKSVNFKPVERITVKFDPFYETTKPIRDFLACVTAPKITATNPKCVIKTDVVCDRSEPTVTFNLVSGEKVIFKGRHLTTLELLQLYNKHISVLAPAETPVAEVKTKFGKTKSAGRR